ncbi:hypothetical protein AB0O34_15795 [Sphaerisporangium sp. NPDC088356]|uniref:hypothetical protein n=1 Tax=Sphaerisporangium sp. NPDC088356 TaxID=3154871 RepID=UPI0034184C6B
MALAAGPCATYLLDMARIVLSILGVVLALYVVFGLVLPLVLGVFKILLIVAVVGVVAVAAVTMVGKLSK